MPAATTSNGETWAALCRSVPVPEWLRPHTLPATRRRPLVTLQMRSFLEGGDLVVSARLFHDLLVEHAALVGVGAGGSFAQFRRLACSLSADVRGRVLPLLARTVPPAEVSSGTSAALAAEVRTGLDAIGEIATDGWVLNGAVERRILALHPDGVPVHLLDAGSIRVHPGHGPVIHHDGQDYRLDKIVRGQVSYTQLGGDRRTPPPALIEQVVAALGPDLDVRPCSAGAVFAAGVRRLARLLDAASRSGETVVVFDADPRAVGVL